MKDMNVAKLTSQDLPLFNGIVSDLFPGVETPTIDYGKVTRCKSLKLDLSFFFFVITYHLQVTKVVDNNSLNFQLLPSYALLLKKMSKRQALNHTRQPF